MDNGREIKVLGNRHRPSPQMPVRERERVDYKDFKAYNGYKGYKGYRGPNSYTYSFFFFFYRLIASPISHQTYSAWQGQISDILDHIRRSESAVYLQI